MKKTFAAFIIIVVSSTPVFSERAFFGDPPDEHHPWAVHDRNRPQPPRVEPGAKPGDAPSDAIILFDGTEESFDNWNHVDAKRKADWTVKDGYMVPARGARNIETKQEFGDCQLHIEWSHESELSGSGQHRGNSGVFLMGLVEIQILDNYENPTYADGTAGAIYGLMSPAANALRPPGQWQSYDIIFRRPIIKDGKVLDQGSLTVLVNGVVVQASTPLDGGGGFRRRKPLNREFPEVGSLSLQDHGSPVRYRNIWCRPLRPREVDGGFDGRISTESTTEKRAEIAKHLRDEAASMEGVEKILQLLESINYTPDEAALAEAVAMTSAYLRKLESGNAQELEKRKGSITSLRDAYQYLQRFNRIPEAYSAASKLEAIMMTQGWIKK